MKILQVAPYFAPYKGGQEIYIYNLSKHLAKMGHNVTVLTTNYPKCQKKEFIDGITVERYPLLARPLRNPITTGFLYLMQKMKDYDVVHAHNEHSFIAMCAAFYRRFVDVPLVLTCHGQLTLNSAYCDALEKSYSETIGKKIFESVDWIGVLSLTDKNYVLNFNEKLSNISIISNAIDQNYLESLIKRTRPFLNSKTADLNFLYVGRMIKRKGLYWLIKAMDIIVNKYHKKNVLLNLVGDGEDKQFLMSFAYKCNLENNIKFLGEVTDERLSIIYQTSDIFVLPSLSEGCPTVILEAMFYGLPVISTNIAAIKDLFDDYAILVPPRKENELAREMILLSDNAEMRHEMSKKGKNLVRESYTWDGVAKQYEKLFNDLCHD